MSLEQDTADATPAWSIRQRSGQVATCPLCRDCLDELLTKRCAGCETVYHDVCLDELGYSCTTLGCQGSSFLSEPQAKPKPKPQSTWSQLAPLGVLALAFLLVLPLLGGTDLKALAQGCAIAAALLVGIGSTIFVFNLVSRQVSDVLDIAMQPPEESVRARADRELRERLRREQARRMRHEQELEGRMGRGAERPFVRGEPPRESPASDSL